MLSLCHWRPSLPCLASGDHGSTGTVTKAPFLSVPLECSGGWGFPLHRAGKVGTQHWLSGRAESAPIAGAKLSKEPSILGACWALSSSKIVPKHPRGAAGCPVLVNLALSSLLKSCVVCLRGGPRGVWPNIPCSSLSPVVHHGSSTMMPQRKSSPPT